MKTALIGYTGFVGSNINGQFKFTDLYNSKNIDKIKNKKYDLIVGAGVAGTKWIANKEPKKDLAKIKNFIRNINSVKTKKFILISTEDVYEKPYKVDEKTSISPDNVQPYGKNRYYLEQLVINKFPNYIIIRLPGLFGEGLKKNFIYDFINNRKPYLTNSESVVQIYNLKNIWKDIKIAIKHSFPVINFATEPIKVKDIIKFAFNKKFINHDKKRLVNYDVSTIYASHYGNKKYLYLKKEILKDLKDFVIKERSKLSNK